MTRDEYARQLREAIRQLGVKEAFLACLERCEDRTHGNTRADAAVFAHEVFLYAMKEYIDA